MSDAQVTNHFCPGTIDWHCLLPAGHAGPHDPGVLKGMAGPLPDWKDVAAPRPR